MAIGISGKIDLGNGELYTISINGFRVRILILHHALERIKKWEITLEMVAEAMILPDEVFSGHRNRYIAHKQFGSHLVRAVYEYEKGIPVLVTVYFPYSSRYFRGGGTYEDKISRGS